MKIKRTQLNNWKKIQPENSAEKQPNRRLEIKWKLKHLDETKKKKEKEKNNKKKKTILKFKEICFQILH